METAKLAPLVNALKKIPTSWDGKDAILEMKNGGSSNWRQMEWIGFYFEYLCGIYLSKLFDLPGPSYGNVKFDGFYFMPWDFKAHVVQSGHHVIVNDLVAIRAACEEYGFVGVIMASGQAEYNDEKRTFKQWHDQAKGKVSRYEIERRARGAPSRRRKTSFAISEILLIQLSEDVLDSHKIFSQGRNSDGSPRNPKLMLDLDIVNDELLDRLEWK